MGYTPKPKSNNYENDYVKQLISQRELRLNESFKRAKAYLTSIKFFEKTLEEKTDYLNTKDGLLLVEGMSADKLSFVRIADCLTINQRALHTALRDNPDMFDAFDRGRSKSIDEIEEALNEMAKGYWKQEVRVKTFHNDRNGSEAKQSETYDRWFAPNAYAATYILNNKRQDEWKDKQIEMEIAKNTIRVEVEIIGDDTVNLS